MSVTHLWPEAPKPRQTQCARVSPWHDPRWQSGFADLRLATDGRGNVAVLTFTIRGGERKIRRSFAGRKETIDERNRNSFGFSDDD